MTSQGKPGKGLVKRLAKLFTQKQRAASQASDSRATAYYGDVLDDSGSVMCEAGPIPLDQKTNEMVEKYRMEARAAQHLNSAPLSGLDERKEAKGQSEGCPQTYPGAAVTRSVEYEADHLPSNEQTEDGITEVKLPPEPLEGLQPTNGLSPLTTASSLGMATYSQQAALDRQQVDPSTQEYHNFLFLDSLASDNMQACQQENAGQQAHERDLKYETVPDLGMIGNPGQGQARLPNADVRSTASAKADPPEPGTAILEARKCQNITDQSLRLSNEDILLSAKAFQRPASPPVAKVDARPFSGCKGKLPGSVKSSPAQTASYNVQACHPTAIKWKPDPVFELGLNGRLGQPPQRNTSSEILDQNASTMPANHLLCSQDIWEQPVQSNLHAEKPKHDPSLPANILTENNLGRRSHKLPLPKKVAQSSQLLSAPDAVMKASRLGPVVVSRDNASDTSCDSQEQNGNLATFQAAQRAGRRVHFTPEKGRATGQAHAYSDAGKPGRHVQFPPSDDFESQLMNEGADQTAIWRNENSKAALNSKVPPLHQKENGKQSVASPSRFLQLASRPSENNVHHLSVPPGWGDQVSMQMELAGTLSGMQPIDSKSKALNSKLQCLRQPMLHSQMLAQTSDGAVTDSMEPRPGTNLRIRTQAAPSSSADAQAYSNARPGSRSSAKRLDKYFSKHQASHTSTTTLIKEATGKRGSDSSGAVPKRDPRISSFVAGRHAMLQAHAAKGVLTSSKTGPTWSGQDWEQSTLTSFQDQNTYSIPPSPSSTGYSIHGHALSHVTSPGRASTLGYEDAWAPDMESIREGDEREDPEGRTLAEMSALSFRPIKACDPPATLTQATLESRAVLDTVACDVDLGLYTSIWPSGHTPSSKGPCALDSVRQSIDGETPQADSTPISHLIAQHMRQRRQLHTIPWGFRYPQYAAHRA